MAARYFSFKAEETTANNIIDSFFHDFIRPRNENNYLAHFHLSLEHKLNEIYVHNVISGIKDVKNKLDKEPALLHQIAAGIPKYKNMPEEQQTAEISMLLKDYIISLQNRRIQIRIIGRNLNLPARAVITESTDQKITKVDIYYNRDLPAEQIRVYIGHEFGHIILAHILQDKIKAPSSMMTEKLAYHIGYKIIKERSDFYQNRSSPFIYESDDAIKNLVYSLSALEEQPG